MISSSHIMAHILRALGWPLLVLGFIAFAGGLDWFWGKSSVAWFFWGIAAMLCGFLFLYVAWNLRRNFYRFIP